MKSKDTIILKKIREYCDQCEEAKAMFGNDYTIQNDLPELKTKVEKLLQKQ